MTHFVVVNADDYGMTRGASLGVSRAHTEGVLTSASVVTTTEHYGHAIDLHRSDCPELGLGLHFTLAAGSPVSSVDKVPLLVGSDGRFRWRFTSLWAALQGRDRDRLLGQIEIELEAQIHRLLDDDVRLDHINSERHIHQLPGVFERVVAAAKRHDVPFVRLGSDVGWRHLMAYAVRPHLLPGGVVKSVLLARLTARNRKHAHGVRSCERFASYLYSGQTDLILGRLFEGLPEDGATEIMVHPGVPEESEADLGNSALEAYLRHPARGRELRACVDAAAPGTAVELVTFHELAQQRGVHAPASG